MANNLEINNNLEVLNVTEVRNPLVVDGITLREIKQLVKYVAEGSEEPVLRTELTRTRWIGDHYYEETTSFNDRGEVTDQSVISSLEGQDAEEAFLQQWNENWTLCGNADAVPIECNCLQTTACQRANQDNGLPEE